MSMDLGGYMTAEDDYLEDIPRAVAVISVMCSKCKLPHFVLIDAQLNPMVQFCIELGPFIKLLQDSYYKAAVERDDG